ncbi:MAG: S8 family peptidase [Lachnospiraceae bacterium]|nr:S8 family peptidase [Lachnospiraceae bacterium]
MEQEECRRKILSNDYADWVIDFPIAEFQQGIVGYPVFDYCYQTVNNDISIVSMNRGELGESELFSVDYHYFPDLFGLEQETEEGIRGVFNPQPLLASGIVGVQNPPLSLSANGVILAFVDTGIRYENPIFRNPDGTTRILAIWDQTIQEGEPPQGFLYGTEYTREMINEALAFQTPQEIVPTTDEIGHGTRMAATAAGSMIEGGAGFLSPAYGADIVVVKLKQCKDYLRRYFLIPDDVPAYQSSDIMMAIKYLDSFAVAFSRPVVFCTGVGSNYRDHSGYGIFSRYLTSIAQKRSRIMMLAGGNEGNAAHHFEKRLSLPDRNGETLENETDMEIRVDGEGMGFITQIWVMAPALLSISIRTPGGERVPQTSVLVQGRLQYRFVYEKTVITVYNALIEQGSGDAMILIRFENPTSGIWTVTVTNDSGFPNTVFNAWLPITQFLEVPVYFLRPEPDLTLTTPSYSEDAITVSTYDSSNNSFYVNSGRGFSRTSVIKPDFSSPGVNVSTVDRTLMGQPVVMQVTGSSMAVAIAAGAAAQFMQWAVIDENAPYIRSTELKNYFIRGAKREEGIIYPSRLWGFGRMNLQGVFDALVQ